MKKLNLFDYLKALTKEKKDLSNDEGFESEYNIFMINRFLSMHPSTTFYAHFVNKGNLNKKSHYLFLLHTLQKKNIFFNYQKKEKIENIKFIQNCYNVGEQRAKEYAKILTKKQLKLIKKKYGGSYKSK